MLIELDGFERGWYDRTHDLMIQEPTRPLDIWNPSDSATGDWRRQEQSACLLACLLPYIFHLSLLACLLATRHFACFKLHPYLCICAATHFNPTSVAPHIPTWASNRKIHAKSNFMRTRRLRTPAQAVAPRSCRPASDIGVS